ncbi:hydroxymethylbilane synthase [Basilea psittacipulmonis]|uniref:Porphobilinogen deaminase n=1 Tax=Basilea psittacipulmonis DSM 24701 TaxID=1072685 RepID=A0A077DI14_9BURK|nr:hydroxymethylbilane synthase [Basilea psittacipulmonis]AIL32758.1 porphobilinogen deaminase [Basilea psittacipulmonis DSM 24701]
MAKQIIRIATRESLLALWQAEHVKKRLESLYADIQVELVKMTTRGDQILDRTLSKVGGKGLFVKELEVALLEGRADMAVHSLKDVSTQLEAGFELVAVLEREDDHDALVSEHFDTLEALPKGAIVGTSSLRREAQIRALYPHLTVKPLRGNVQTRLNKLKQGDYHAIILAAAGLKRLALSHEIKQILPYDVSLPAVGQGALGIEILSSRQDIRALLKPLICPITTACTSAERKVSTLLGGSCQVPLAAHATHKDGQLFLQALVAMPDGSRVVKADAWAPVDQAEHLGETVAQQLIQLGAKEILECQLS